eukprot:scaffold7141_cov56-Attheya_sp.AAC.3
MYGTECSAVSNCGKMMSPNSFGSCGDAGTKNDGLLVEQLLSLWVPNIICADPDTLSEWSENRMV